MREVVKALVDALESNREIILCQVVETRGSTPQKAGVMMVVDPLGGQCGTLGGGCVENEVKQLAIRQLGTSEFALHRFVLDHDPSWADGLICGGRMVVSIQSLRGGEPLAYFREYRRLLDTGEGFTEAIIADNEAFPGEPVGRRFLSGPDGSLQASWPTGRIPTGVVGQIAPLSTRPGPLLRGGLALLPCLPRIRLIVVGAGHVGQAVARLAAEADFDVWVVDDRAQYANAERFPQAERILVGSIERVLPSLEITPNTYALIVTRGHGHDQEALYHLAPTPASYVGLIGSKRKIRLIFENLRDQGIPESSLRRVSAPVGLELGSQTVFEIAVSIVAELIAWRNLGPIRTAGSLSDRLAAGQSEAEAAPRAGMTQ